MVKDNIFHTIKKSSHTEMEGANKHSLMILYLSFTYRACMDYILAGQFMYMYITKEAIWLACAIFFVHTII